LYGGISPLRTPSSAQQLALELRTAIMRGELRPGEPLRETPLASAARVSRDTVRGAIKALADDGLVVHQRYRGAVVVQPSHADVIDVFRTRELLELGAIDAWPNAPQARRDAVGEAIGALEQAAHGADSVELTDRDLDFHAALVGLLDGERIDAFYRTVRSAVALYFAMLYRGNQPWEDPRQVAEEHREIHVALLAGDVGRARALMERLLHSNRDRLLELIG
jgi:DNA-binding GntR family transcriptional regulator